jgi:hypothetical protein
MKNYLFVPVLIVVFLSACKEKIKPEEETPISAVSIIKGDLHKLDSLLFEIKKIETQNGISDTSYLKKDDLKKYAAPFLDLQDIANNNYTKNYKEDRFIDAESQSLNIISTATGDAEIQKQIIIVDIADISSGKVKSIYIDRYKTSGDSSIQLKLSWEIDKSFLVDSIIQRNDQSERIHRVKVEWQ